VPGAERAEWLKRPAALALLSSAARLRPTHRYSTNFSLACPANWSKFHKAIQPTQKKLALLGKNPTGNHDLILSLLRNMHEPIDDLVRNLIYLNRSNLKAQNASVDWDAVKKTANDSLLHIGNVDTLLGKL
jgi:hypothetical protein